LAVSARANTDVSAIGRSATGAMPMAAIDWPDDNASNLASATISPTLASPTLSSRWPNGRNMPPMRWPAML
jgi:hypothetical protein